MARKNFSSKNLSQTDRERIASGLFTVKKNTGKELSGLCPFHEEKTPSFGYSSAKDAFNCFSCGAKGDLIALWSHANNFSDPQKGYKAFCKSFDKDYASTPTPSKKKSPRSAKSIPEKRWEAVPKLPDPWAKRCREKFGWSQEIIDKHDIRLHTGKNGEKRLAIPVRNDEGRLKNVRLYLPGADENKVISWGAGYGSARLFPTPSFWGQSPIFLCEGEKDTLCALSHGLNAVTQTAGVRTWKKEFNPWFEGLDVVICYDADSHGKEGAERVASSLARIAKSVRILQWPEYMGFSEDHGEDLTDFFVKHKKKISDFKDLLATAKTVEKPPEPEITSTPSRFFGGKNGRRFMPALLAQAIMEDMEIVSDPEKGLIYRWNGQFWENYDIAFIRNRALLMMGDEASSARAADAAAIVRDLSVLKHGRRMNDKENWICLKNGMFNLETYEIKPFDKGFYANYQVQAEYLSQQPFPEDWMKFLVEAVEDMYSILEIQKFFGYCLTRETRYEKALILLGPGGDGKSTILDILQLMVGEENCSNVPLGRLEDEFYCAALVDKILNVAPETENRAFSTDLFKAIVSGDRISASFKHKDPFNFRPFCKLAFAANRHPRVLDNSDGFFRRVIMIEMNKRFVATGQADIFLREKLKKEISAIFMWALDGLKLLREDGFKEPPVIKKALHDYRRSNNPVQCFAEECLKYDPECQILISSKQEIFEAYKAYCRVWMYRPYGHSAFGRELKMIFPDLRSGRFSSGDRNSGYFSLELIRDPSHPRFSSTTSQEDEVPSQMS